MHKKLLDICIRIMMVREKGRCENCRVELARTVGTPIILFAFQRQDSPLYYNPRSQVLVCSDCGGGNIHPDIVQSMVRHREGIGWWGFAETVAAFNKPFEWTEPDMVALAKKLEYELEAYQ